MSYPIPNAALDDRLAIVGTSGSGKTYAAGTAVERLLKTSAKVVIVDPLDVWWGLRVKANGKDQAFPVVLFGGEQARSDFHITEDVGGVIGEAVATMAESCVVSLSTLGSKASERRFMLAFLEAMYRKATGEPMHIVFDEADLWAPQRAIEPQLQALMENIVRRGRVKGFVPWLITQRPAVISKDVLSQADGLVAMKLTSSQDRDALGAWIEGQADRADEKRMLARLPKLQRGQGVVWIPARDVLTEATFPEKVTFDSSATPKRGEPARRAALKPLDTKALVTRIADIAKARDAKKGAKVAPTAAADAPKVDLDALKAAARAEGEDIGYRRALNDVVATLQARVQGQPPPPVSPPQAVAARPSPPQRAPAMARQPPSGGPANDLSGPERNLLAAIAFWEALGKPTPSRVMAAAVAGWRVTSGHLKNVCGSLSTKRLLTYPGPGLVAMTPEGRAVAPPAPGGTVKDMVRSILTGPQRAAFDALLDHRDQSREELCTACGWNPNSGHPKNVLGSLSSLELITYPRPGHVRLADWIE